MNAKRLYGFRGAICAENTYDAIFENVRSMFEQLVFVNNLVEHDMVSIQFTVTPDITALNPATALRKAGLVKDVPLFCSQEPVFESSLKSVIRCMILAYSDNSGKAVYLNGAQVLRPDLADNAEYAG
ncbi:MAG: chorismate mutase [Treponemataceae bacterium]